MPEESNSPDEIESREAIERSEIEQAEARENTAAEDPDLDESTARELSPGEQAVGIHFNPSANPRVQRLKELAAEMFDIVENSVPANDGTVETARKRKMRDSALEKIITAQMWGVKVVTLEQ